MVKKKVLTPYELFPSFVSEILVIFEVFNNDVKKFQKQIDKREFPIYGDEIPKNKEKLFYNNSIWYQKESAKLNMQKNAYFSYSYSLFEKNLNELLQYLIRNDSTVKDRYFKKWNKFIDDGGQNKYENINSDILRDNEAQFQNYEILIRHEKTTYENFLSSILGIKFPQNNLLKKQRAAFHINREIRNLLVHRSEKIDSKLIESLSRNNFLKKNPEELNKFYEFQFKRFNRHKKYAGDESPSVKKPTDLIDKKVDIDINAVLTNLIFMMAWFTMQTPINSKYISVEDANNNFGQIYHDILIANRKVKHILISKVVSLIFEVKSESIHNIDENKISDIEKFNYLLALHQEYEISKQFKESELPNLLKKRLSKAIDKYFKFESLDENMEKLLMAYLKNNKKEFLFACNQIDVESQALEEWYIFKKWENDPNFKKLLKK
jgi:hypothetical protein